ncbi:MAG: hypothetical protein R3Y23_03415 [Bacillota bacterium]
MKKLIISVLAVIMLFSGVVALTACNSSDETYIVSIVGVLDEDVELSVGDAYDATNFVLTATLSDESEVIITSTAAYTYDRSGLDLDNSDCYATAGEQTMVITYLTYEVKITFTVAE